MTVETEVANLTTAVDNLAEAVNVKKATLDASVADAESARDAAAASATTASGHATSAAASAAAAASTASGIAGFDLDAIAATKAVTAVDVFVYDTSKDSDGGAWRKRTQHTSWYNETLNTATRGARREFPAVAVIVAESNKVTIYDGDDPALPMWMVFNAEGGFGSSPLSNAIPGDTITSLAMMNGTLNVGTDNSATGRGGVNAIRFISEYVDHKGISSLYRDYNGNISERNSNKNYRAGDSFAIVNSVVNDVAMTVLPDAPIDPATGLPVPTIAVATDGGTSVINNDGTVFDLTRTGGHSFVTVIDGDKIAVNRKSGGFDIYLHQLPVLADTNDFTGELIHFGVTGNINLNLTLQAAGRASGDTFSGSNGLAFTRVDYSSPNTSLFTKVTSTYNTGWMNGDIKGAFLSSTDTTSLVGSGELVTNGTFDTDISGWSAQDSTLSVVSQRLRITAAAAVQSRAYQDVPTVVGKTYVMSVDVTMGTDTRAMIFAYGAGFQSVASNIAITASGTYLLTFVANSTTTRITLFNYTSTIGVYTDFDNVSVKLADADRSVNNNGLIVNGTITRTYVDEV